MDAAAPLRPVENDETRRRKARNQVESLRAQRQRERAGLEALAERVSALRARQRALRR